MSCADPLRLVLALVLGLASSCVPPGGEGDVVLVTLDTTRADRLGCYGNPRVRTPHLDRLASEATLFERAFTPIPSTLPSHASILTGTSPARHGLHDNAVYALAADATTLAEALGAAGFATGAFVSAFVLDRQFGLAQGFDVYDDAMELPLADADPRAIPRDLPEGVRRWFAQLASPYQRRADAVTRRALAWLESLGARRAFLWVHYFDPHQPYQAPAPWTTAYDPHYAGELDGDVSTFTRLAQRRGWTRLEQVPEVERAHMIARYEGEISYTDEWLGALLDGLARLGRLERALVVVVGDHGESFGEHAQLFEHHGELFDAAVRVPLLVRRPDGVGRGARVPGLVRTYDVMPTVLDWVGVETGEEVEGVSLLPLTRDPASVAPGELVLEALRPPQVQPTSHWLLGLRTGRWKLVRELGPDGRVRGEALYDLVADPGEQHSLAGEQPGRVRELGARLDGLRARQGHSPDRAAQRPLDVLTSEALRALGYLDP
jgi:arylsulfatase A-like enzyme